MQVPLTRKHWQTTGPTPPTGRNLQNKEEPQTSSVQKGHPKLSNLNKIKRQRNIHQVKEHDKSPPNQTKEEGIGSLPRNKFRIIIVNMIQNLENKMELQVNRLETRIEKMQKMFNKDLEEKNLHIWGYWYFSRQSWFQLVLLPAQHFSWCTLHIS